MIERPQEELSLREIISRLPQVDLVLTEGYKKAIILRSRSTGRSFSAPLIAPPEQLLAIMTDEPLDVPVCQLGLEDTAGCAALILDYLSRFQQP